MPYQIKVERRVEKELASLPQRDRRRIIAAIDALAENPRPAGCVPVKGAPRGTYRLRVGSYRVIYLIMDDEHLVTVTRVRRRGKGTYRGL